jgi:flavin reductase (DIM6/NTAB) family NADH-FMN oxidoreductase RutF
VGANKEHGPEAHVSDDLQQAAARVYDLLDPPLWLVTSVHAGERGGFIATFAARASIVREFPRMVLGVAKQHHTWGLIQRSRRFALHLLYPHQLDLVWRFGLQHGHQADKFAGIEAELTPGRSPLVPQALAWLDCSVEDQMDTGDRTVFLAAVESAASNGADRPLTVRRLYSDAPADRRKRLDELYARDGRIDAEAIVRWRRNSHRR